MLQLIVVVMAVMVLLHQFQVHLLLMLAVEVVLRILLLVELLEVVELGVVVLVLDQTLLAQERLTQEVVEVVLQILLDLAVQASSLFPTHLQLNYSVVELLLYQAVNLSIPLLHLAH